MESASMEPADALAELSRIRLDEVALDDVLARVAELANRAVPGSAHVSVSLVQAGANRAIAYTSDLARSLDEWQYAHDDGPCLDASMSAVSICLPDLADEPRWPGWAARARAAGVQSSLSIGLPIQEAVTGALNIHGGAPRAFDKSSIELAEEFAAYAAVALANAHLYESTATLARQMQEAMRSRAVIEQAKGIIMGQRRCSAEEAFTLLAKLSQDSNRKLREVAEALVSRAAAR
ncbi:MULTISPECIES: GAF and ANTAR domain-containing protein [Micromonospora]|uniref:GAF and ANTAR domain-containing protein n=1 Tax=Micromonospora aurantiaca (nom. illeg.) TaxID=47850 RepID=A0ABQ6UJ03_9ACTN|nr:MULTISPECIES: GAF and ANTAR domain-containing protein [Micromonospora]ADL44160.1 ANTAR domain protein [Micromonospora aurantiaca ATCC 27029]ADU06335.1 ANTAR domain protein [Micromonospora sp. L5]KAB1116882.1 GAF and ANTAR domain-containing protein [Micromonospora aurantiaca]UFN95150.1 GAF and ANTAR domain-containing protein [Micromonospora aurantiaca]SCL37804.1 GAF domain-containing protein [Micromonospora aurantiaca]